MDQDPGRVQIIMANLEPALTPNFIDHGRGPGN